MARQPAIRFSKRPRFERALFVLGYQNAGKSTAIRRMYKDWRMGRQGQVPQKRTTRFPVIRLSNERMLYVRVQSPQERGEDWTKFTGRIDRAIRTNGPNARWNSACAMQISRGTNIAGGLSVIRRFIRKYKPERVRVALMNPPARGDALTDDDLTKILEGIQALAGEPLQVYGRGQSGFLLADFFDFI